jgi:hypothetical protein
MTPHCVSITEQTTEKSYLLLNIVYMHRLYKKMFYSKDDQEIENALSNDGLCESVSFLFGTM